MTLKSSKDHDKSAITNVEAQLQTKRYILASDFDQTLSFNDSGYVLSELLGIPESEFERKIQGMAKLNLVQQGGELAYLLLHDPEFRTRCGASISTRPASACV